MDKNRYYKIQIDCCLSEKWFFDCNELEISFEDEGGTTLQGWMDQSALYGILNRLRDLGVPLKNIQEFTDKTRNP